MSYDSSQDWQMMSPAWRDEQIHKCLCTLKTNLASYFEGAGGVQPLIYRALLTQTGTDAPTAIVLENTLGEVPTFSYSNIGIYAIENTGNVFTANKTFIQYNGVINASNSTPSVISASWVSDSSISIYTSIPSEAGGGTLGLFAASDGLLNNTEIAILVYP